MPDIEALLNRWQSAGVLDAESAARIRAYELNEVLAERSAPQVRDSRLRIPADHVAWQGMTALILGAILLAGGMALFVSAHWSQLGPGARFALVLAMVGTFHLGGGLTRESFRGLSTALHAIGTLASGPAIALVGQIFEVQAHWPAAVLLWLLAALAGWILLRDQAQQALALLLVPAWMVCELAFRVEGSIGDSVYLGRLLFTWAILYLTFFAGSRRRAVREILFAAGAIAAASGTLLMLTSWISWSPMQTFIPFGTRVGAWTAIAALPLIIAAFHGHKGLVPIVVAVGFALALPWCSRTWTESYAHEPGFTRTAPNLLAHLLVAGFALFLCAWGVRLASRALVNLGLAGFAAAVIWFYFSDVFSALGRSLGLIGLGILFLAGGWALEKARRRILARMGWAAAPTHRIAEAQ